MPYSDQERQKKAQKEWYQTVVKKRREDWFNANGPCAKCGSWEELELDHIDPSKKVSHSVWSWGDKKRREELAKCQALCHKCHARKSAEYYREIDIWKNRRIVEPEGMAWCSGHSKMLSRNLFSTKPRNRNGLNAYCRECRKEARKQGKSY